MSRTTADHWIERDDAQRREALVEWHDGSSWSWISFPGEGLGSVDINVYPEVAARLAAELEDVARELRSWGLDHARAAGPVELAPEQEDGGGGWTPERIGRLAELGD